MRNCCDLLKRSKKKKFLTKLIFAKKDNILNTYVYFANRLKYNISEIAILKKNIRKNFIDSINHLPLLVTDKSEFSKKDKKCNFSTI